MPAAAATKIIVEAGYEHAAGHLNLAFLSAYQRDFETARRRYKSAWKKKPDMQLVNRACEFLKWLAKRHPERAPVCYWCLGMILSNNPDDQAAAFRYFEIALQRLDDLPPTEVAHLQQIVRPLELGQEKGP